MGNQHSESSHRIIKVKPDSPVSDLPIEPMIDFILYVPSDTNPNMTIESYLSANENKEIEMTFFNIASQKTWKRKITPRKWKGEGLLGVTLHNEDYKTAHNKVIHILEFKVNSPLHKAGFKPYVDYILGTFEYAFETVDSFTSYIKMYNKKPIDLYVYNSEDENVRKLTLIPDSEWGGSGQLGGEIGYGHIHSLPTRKKDVPKDQEIIEKTDKPIIIPEKSNIEDKEVKKENIVESQTSDKIIESKIETQLEKAVEISIKKEEVKKTEEIKVEKAAEVIIGKKLPSKESITEIAVEVNKDIVSSSKPIIKEEKVIEKAIEVVNTNPTEEKIESKKEVEKVAEIQTNINVKVESEPESSEASINTFDDDIMI